MPNGNDFLPGHRASHTIHRLLYVAGLLDSAQPRAACNVFRLETHDPRTLPSCHAARFSFQNVGIISEYPRIVLESQVPPDA